jgi:hypothetical protein
MERMKWTSDQSHVWEYVGSTAYGKWTLRLWPALDSIATAAEIVSPEKVGKPEPFGRPQGCI